MFSRPKPKRKADVSCPFCGDIFEDVTEHVSSCSGVAPRPGASLVSPRPTKPSVPFSPSAVPPPGSRETLNPTTARPKPGARSLPIPGDSSGTPAPGVVSPRRPLSPGRCLPATPQHGAQTSRTPTSTAEPSREKKPLTLVKSSGSMRGRSPAAQAGQPRPQPKPSTWTPVSTKPSGVSPRGGLGGRGRQPGPAGTFQRASTAREMGGEPVPARQPVIPVVSVPVAYEAPVEQPKEKEQPTGIALYDYAAASESEISLTKGERVHLLDLSDPEWIYVRGKQGEGFAPVAYIENEDQSDCNEPLSPIATSPTSNSSPTSPGNHSGSYIEALKKKPSVLGALGFNKKKKPAIEFTISRAETPPNVPSSSGGDDSSSSEQLQRDLGNGTAKTESKDQRTNIAEEILSTETHFLDVIENMINRYRETILFRMELFGSSITKEMVMDIFGNLEMIIPINKQLQSDLQTAVDHWNEQSTLGDIFIRVAPFFRMYNQYSTRYDHALTTLTKCMKNEEFLALVEEIDTTTKLGSRLESLLIAPIQRIPRYNLLLQELRKATPEGHPDCQHLDKAIPVLQDVANYINSNMSAVENQEKLLSLSLAGAQSLLKPHRVLLHEGVLPTTDKKKMHIWLFNDIVVQLPEGETKNKENLNKPKYQWPLHLVWLGETCVKSKTQASYTITGPTKSYTLVGLIEEITVWVEKIHSAIVQHLEYLMVTQDKSLEQEKKAQMTWGNPARFGSFCFPNTASYTGWWNLGLFQGSGKLDYFDSVYEGTFISSLKEGTGSLRYITRDIYEGEWKNDRPHGRGVFTYSNGDVFRGNWQEGLKHGKGELNCVLGDSYCGEWVRDQPHGLGEMSYASGLLYNGNWENGERHHYGILINPTGERYEGEWVRGIRHGKGRMEHFEGSVYDGYWKEGYYQGKGTLTTPSGTYEGEFVMGWKEGTGTMTYPNGKVYKGSWKRDQYHGQGSLTCLSGLVQFYNGEWHQNQRQGSGILRFFNGDLYEGHFKDNKFHGSGTYSFGSGNSVKGKWSKGVISGECQFTRPSRPDEKKADFTYSGTYKNGLVVAPDRPPIYLPNIPTGEIDLL